MCASHDEVAKGREDDVLELEGDSIIGTRDVDGVAGDVLGLPGMLASVSMGLSGACDISGLSAGSDALGRN